MLTISTINGKKSKCALKILLSFIKKIQKVSGTKSSNQIRGLIKNLQFLLNDL